MTKRDTEAIKIDLKDSKNCSCPMNKNVKKMSMMLVQCISMIRCGLFLVVAECEVSQFLKAIS